MVKSRAVHVAVSYIVLGIFLVLALFPVIYMVLVSFKSFIAIYHPFSVEFYTRNYIAVFFLRPIGNYLRNTITASLSSAALAMIIGMHLAYSASRWGTGGKNLPFLVLTFRMAPPVVFAIPLFIYLHSLGLLNNVLGLILVYTAMNLPLVVWVMKSFFDQIPIEFEQAAYIDGCSVTSAFYRVILPMLPSPIIAIFVICVFFSWIEFLWALLFTRTPVAETLTVGLSTFYGSAGWQWGQLMAAGVIAVIPLYIIVLLGRKYLAQGFAWGIALK